MPFNVSSLRIASASLEPVSDSGSDSEFDFNYELVSVVEPFDIFGTPGNEVIDLGARTRARAGISASILAAVMIGHGAANSPTELMAKTETTLS